MSVIKAAFTSGFKNRTNQQIHGAVTGLMMCSTTLAAARNQHKADEVINSWNRYERTDEEVDGTPLVRITNALPLNEKRRILVKTHVDTALQGTCALTMLAMMAAAGPLKS